MLESSAALLPALGNPSTVVLNRENWRCLEHALRSLGRFMCVEGDISTGADLPPAARVPTITRSGMQDVLYENRQLRLRPRGRFGLQAAGARGLGQRPDCMGHGRECQTLKLEESSNPLFHLPAHQTPACGVYGQHPLSLSTGTS